MSDANFTSDTMPLPALVAALVERCGVSESVAETFVTAFTETVVAALRTDNIVKIKGIGSFSIDSSGNIVFEADADVAEMINAPFSIFEPVEIDGSELSEDIAAIERPAEVRMPLPNAAAKNEGTEILEEEVAEEVTGNPTKESTEESYAGAEPEPSPDFEPEPEPEPISEPESETSDDSESEMLEPKEPTPYVWHDNDDEVEPRVVKVIVREHPWLTGILAGVAGLLIGLGCGYFLYPRLNFNRASGVELSAGYVNVIQNSDLRDSTSREGFHDAAMDSVATTTGKTQPVDSAVAGNNATSTIEAAPATKPVVVYDTIRRNRFLTTMAREHYGRKIFWVYIYEENKAVISDPDNIAPNTVVVIPPAEKYGIKAGDKFSEQAAERKAVEIIGDNS